MVLRWLRESVTWKPWRPLTEWLRGRLAVLVGRLGAGAKTCWHQWRRAAAPSPLVAAALRRIVVLRPDRIGDVVLATPALRALRTACPQARLTVIASPVTAPLLRQLSSVDEVLVVGGDRFSDFWHARDRLRTLRRTQPDLVMALEVAWPAAWLAWWLGAPHRIGYDLDGMGWMFTQSIAYPFLQRKAHQIAVNLHLLAAVGIAVPPLERASPEVLVTDSARRAAEAWLTAHRLTDAQRLVLVHPGSRSRYTQWDPTRYAVVADRVAQETGSSVIVLCGPGEDAIVHRMLAAMTTRPVVAKDLPLDVITALFQRCQLFIGNATGTMHLASAVTPHVIAVIGGTHPHDCPERWGPWGRGHRSVHRPPEAAIGRSTWRWLGAEGLRYILPDDVMATVHDVLTPQMRASDRA